MINQSLNKLKVKFLNLFSNKLNKKTSESPQIIKRKKIINKFGYPVYTDKEEENTNK
tara:strand:+ start:873 stop:1043 length:171 start_codon:yes stop_codon:yes gene_type:complete